MLQSWGLVVVVGCAVGTNAPGDEPDSSAPLRPPVENGGADGEDAPAAVSAGDPDDGDHGAIDTEASTAGLEPVCATTPCAQEPPGCAEWLNACDDGNSCTVDSCDRDLDMCVHAPDDSSCDDGNACTGTAVCDPELGCLPGTPIVCDDQNACTVDSCDAATGACSYSPVDACAPGDGCCPPSCRAESDSDCVCANLATSATASSSGGGQDIHGYGPASWIDGDDESRCNESCSNACFGWINNGTSPNGAYLRLDWPSPVSIGSMFLDGTDSNCEAQRERTLAGGTVQAWQNGAWVDVVRFEERTGDIELDFDPPMVTSRVRIFDAVAARHGGLSLLFEWYVYGPIGCFP